MYMNRPYIFLTDIFYVCIPTQNIQLVNEITDTIIVEGKQSELIELLSKYGNHKVYRIEPYGDTLIIAIEP